MCVCERERACVCVRACVYACACANENQENSAYDTRDTPQMTHTVRISSSWVSFDVLVIL